MEKVVNIIETATNKKVIAMPDLTETWLSWFKGNVENFHNYKIYNGRKQITCTRKTLNMPKKISEDWANLLLNEKTDVSLNDEQKKQDLLQDLLNKVHFWQKGNEGVEKTFALGNGAFVEGFDSELKPRLQFVIAPKIFPLTIDQDIITECAFVNINTKDAVIQIHTKNDNANYVIRTIKCKMENNNVGEITEDTTLETKSSTPWFQLVKPNIANNIDINSPLGISIFANAVDTLAGVDLAYDGFCEEMRLGRARIFVDKQLMSYSDGEEKMVFDPNDTGFHYYGDGSTGDNKEPLKFYNPALRTNDYFAGINNALNLLSSKVGFGENHYRFDKGGIATATQVISENSEMFRTLKKHEIILNDTIIGVCKALMYIHNEFTNSSEKFDLNANIEVKFDDSIIEDKETQKLSDRQDISLGVMSKVQYRMKWYNEDEETARQNIEDIEQANQSSMSNFFSSEE